MNLRRPPAAELAAAVEQHFHQAHHASELEYHLLLAKDLKLIKPKDHAELWQRTTELKRMLTALLQKLTADG